jgi:hypothetical protein
LNNSSTHLYKVAGRELGCVNVHQVLQASNAANSRRHRLCFDKPKYPLPQTFLLLLLLILSLLLAWLAIARLP